MARIARWFNATALIAIIITITIAIALRPTAPTPRTVSAPTAPQPGPATVSTPTTPAEHTALAEQFLTGSGYLAIERWQLERLVSQELDASHAQVAAATVLVLHHDQRLHDAAIARIMAHCPPAFLRAVNAFNASPAGRAYAASHLAEQQAWDRNPRFHQVLAVTLEQLQSDDDEPTPGPAADASLAALRQLADRSGSSANARLALIQACQVQVVNRGPEAVAAAVDRTLAANPAWCDSVLRTLAVELSAREIPAILAFVNSASGQQWRAANAAMTSEARSTFNAVSADLRKAVIEQIHQAQQHAATVPF